MIRNFFLKFFLFFFKFFGICMSGFLTIQHPPHSLAMGSHPPLCYTTMTYGEFNKLTGIVLTEVSGDDEGRLSETEIQSNLTLKAAFNTHLRQLWDGMEISYSLKQLQVLAWQVKNGTHTVLPATTERWPVHKTIW